MAFLRYYGMMPGIVSGHYRDDDGLIDLRALASTANIRFLEETVVSLDVETQHIGLKDGTSLPFDYCSIDTGGISRAESVLDSDSRILDIRPIDRFAAQWRARLDASNDRIIRIAVIGGGAGGVELAFALRNSGEIADRVDVRLICGRQGLLPDHGALTRKFVAQELARQNIRLDERDAQLVNGQLFADTQSIEPVDHIITALGGAAARWPAQSGLAVDEDGFVMVDRYQRSVSHPNILATGDIAARQDRVVPHSGVHAVRTGPVLAANLRSILAGAMPTRSYSPRLSSLYLLSTGNRSAILSYGPIAARGRWVWRLKRWIDKRWVRAYARLAGRS